MFPYLARLVVPKHHPVSPYYIGYSAYVHNGDPLMTIRRFKPISAKFITGAAMLALIAGASPVGVQSAYADDCLLDTNNDGNADTDVDTDGGADSGGIDFRLACGFGASATGQNSTALGHSANAAGGGSTALGNFASAAGVFSTALGAVASAAGEDSTAVGKSASAVGDFSTALGNSASAAGLRSTAIGRGASAGVRATVVGYGSNAGLNAVALGGDSSDVGDVGPQALGDNSIVIGTDAGDGSFADAVIIGFAATATEADQVILKSADTFTILGNGDVGIGTAAPLANLDINSGAADTTLLLTNTSAQWELKSKASTGRLNFKNLTDGGVPFKLGPSAVNSLLSVGTMADDLVEVRGELMVEGDVDVTGTLTTGGPTCGGGCDAVFDADYDLPSIEEHAAQMYAKSYLPEIGPTVPHAPVNLSEQYGKVINELEKAHIYIAQINKEKQEMKMRLAALEKLVLK